VGWCGCIQHLGHDSGGALCQGTRNPAHWLVEVRGAIATDSEANADNLMAALRSAFEDHGARAVILRINSPGGSPVQAGLVHDEIIRLKALHKKKVYAVCEEMCASAAYYIAVAADQVVVDKASLVGSIGVLMDGFGFTGVMDKIGVERRLMTVRIQQGHAGPLLASRPGSRNLCTGHAGPDSSAVHRSGRQRARQAAEGKCRNSSVACSGMVSRLSAWDWLTNWAASIKSPAMIVKAEDIIDYTQKENLAERLAKRFGAAIGSGAVQAMRESVSIR
jgi:protease-4